MLGFPFLSDACRHPVQFPARAFDLTLCLFLLPAIHLRQSCGRWLPLRFQKQFRLGEDALADHARAVPPGGIELPSLPRVAMVLDESGGHLRALLQADARHWDEVLHGQLRGDLAFAHLLLDDFPAAAPPAPSAAEPNSRCGRSGAPTPPANSPSVAPSPTTAS